MRIAGYVSSYGLNVPLQCPLTCVFSGQTESSYVIFTDDPAKRYEDFTDADFSQKDDNLGIKYENNDIFEDTVLLLRYNCPDRSCDVACLGWPDLHRHVKSKHGKVMWYVLSCCAP